MQALAWIVRLLVIVVLVWFALKNADSVDVKGFPGQVWQAPLAFVGQATSEVRAKLNGAEVPHALVIDSERKPLGWLSEADLAAETVPARPDTSPDPVVELDDVMRDALSDLLQAETRYAPVVDARGAIAGVLSVEIISEFLTSADALTEEHPAAERPLGA